MAPQRTYMAASVPRFLRQTRLGYLPLNAVIGSRLVTGDGGENLCFDIIMLPAKEFQRMRGHVGLQHVIAPVLKFGPTFNPAFVLADTKQIVVPADQLNPEEFARNYFMKAYGLIAADKPVKDKNESPFSKLANECTRGVPKKISSFFVGLVLACLFLAACTTEPTPPTTPKRVLTPVRFADLPNWQQDTVAEALPAFRRSCQSLGRKTDWAGACAALAAVPDNDNQAARGYFETWFRPYAVSDNGKRDGLFTGYYEAELHGSMQRHGAYQTPLYAWPTDLIAVDLGDFKTEWKGKHLVGKVVGQNLKPYDDRAAIARGSLANRAAVLAWVDDPVSAFFLAVQGSGRVRLDDGRTLNIGYDGANGRDYVAIGRKLADSGDLPKPVTMQSIRAWLAAHPNRADDVMNMNPSFVFFRTLQGDGPIGAQGVALTPRRSLAVDPAFVALGTPVWLDSADGEGQGLQRLMIAQDTGGAIKGVVRGDMFWGFGAEAERKAGAMQSTGRAFLLLPKTVTGYDQ